jgi:hypothetical protein
MENVNIYIGLMNQYKFKLKKRNVFSDEFHLTSDMNLQVFNNNDDLSGLLIKIEVQKLDNHFKITSLSFADSLSESGYSAKISPETIGYLRGHFGLKSSSDLDKAVYDLKNTLSGQYVSNTYTDSWKRFKQQFFDWYTEVLKPIVTSEINLYQECLNINNANN